MIPRLIIGFLFFFFVSRFFSETIQILPKWIDVLDVPFVLIAIAVIGVIFPKKAAFPREFRWIGISTVVVFAIAVASALVNIGDFFYPAVGLFIIGFLGGPLLFIALNKSVLNPIVEARRVKNLFTVLLFVNLSIVVFFNLPEFLVTGNPDVISGSFGLNQYFFSVFLIVASGLLIGMGELRHQSKLIMVIVQVGILTVFYLLQYRAAVPFFLFTYAVMLVAVYGKKVVRAVAVFGVITFGVFLAVDAVVARTEIEAKLKYEDLVTIAQNPGEFFQYGKFVVYGQTLQLFADQPAAAIIGVGPGNYVSRAYYTFSEDMKRAGNDKVSNGASFIISQLTGLSTSRTTEVSKEYLAPTRTGAVLGTFQLSNPNSSIIAPIAEIGLIGGLFIICMYGWIVKKSFSLLRRAQHHAREFLPLATALLAGSIYLLCIAFLDNYWEMSRCTFQIWLLLWATQAGVRAREDQLRSERKVQIEQKHREDEKLFDASRGDQSDDEAMDADCGKEYPTQNPTIDGRDVERSTNRRSSLMHSVERAVP